MDFQFYNNFNRDKKVSQRIHLKLSKRSFPNEILALSRLVAGWQVVDEIIEEAEDIDPRHIIIGGRQSPFGKTLFGNIL